jgi:citrate lyase beta subunit
MRPARLVSSLARPASSAAAAAVSPRRSALYIPGSNLRALEKAKALPADTLILDLEDAVAPESKEVARRQIAEAVRSGAYGRRELVVRINAAETAWGRDDIEALCGRLPEGARPPTLLLPKAERVESVEEALAEASRLGCPRGTVQLWCMIETPLGVLAADELAAHAAVGCLVAGTSDLAAELRCDGAWEARAALLPHLARVVLAARAHGKASLDACACMCDTPRKHRSNTASRLPRTCQACLDGVHLDLADQAGFEASCAQASTYTRPVLLISKLAPSK